MNKIFEVLAISVALLTSPVALMAGERVVPNVVAYQSLLFDDGGNPIPDGAANATFRITDTEGQSLYEEAQTLDVIGGRISALIGNGLTPDGAPTGGIPISLFDPSGARFLEVQIEGQPAVLGMEVAAVPYAMYAQETLSVARGGVTGESIANQSITYENLSRELIDKLAQEITKGKGAGEIVYRQDVKEIFSAPESSASIGVKPGFVYSAATDLQGTLTDLDRAIKRRDEKIDTEAGARTTADTAEVTARVAADKTHAETNIGDAHPNGALPIGRLDADVATQAELDAEIAARQVQDNNLSAQVAADVAAANASALGAVNNLKQELSPTLAKAWVKFRVANDDPVYTPTILKSYGVKNVTTSAAEQLATIWFDPPFADADYVCTASINFNNEVTTRISSSIGARQKPESVDVYAFSTQAESKLGDVMFYAVCYGD